MIAKRMRAAMRTSAVPAALALIGVTVLIGLGTWQLDRKAWKERLISSLKERQARPPVILPPPELWDKMTPARDEFRRVAFSAVFLHEREAHVYTAGSALRADVTGPGYFVFTPARLPDGRLVMVDRGFVPEGRRDPKTRSQAQVSGQVRLIGALRWPEEPGWFIPDADPAHNLWFRRDPAGMARAKGLGPIAPFYVAQEAPIPAGGLPKPGPLTAHLRNAHLQYALTWYGLAVVLIVVFMSWVIGRRRAA